MNDASSPESHKMRDTTKRCDRRKQTEATSQSDAANERREQWAQRANSNERKQSFR